VTFSEKEAQEKTMRIVVTRLIPDEGLQVLWDSFPKDSVVVYQHDRPIPRAELLETVRGADALLPLLTERIDAELMDAAGPQLKVVANMAVGYNNVDIHAATERTIMVTNTPGVLTETTADLAWALLMAAARRISESERYLRAGKWEAWGPRQFLGVDVHGKTLGIFGMGRIGRAVARRARGFDMKVIYNDLDPLSPATEEETEARFVDKKTLVAESDFISIHCPLIPETWHAFGSAEFQLMKKTVVLVNSSRGPVVDEEALANALKAGDIFAAGLDVYEEEPKINAQLLECENAVLIPHLGSASRETRARMAEMAAQNIVAALKGETPPNLVNP
jgi:glyoxylate reductase